ncbi:MAG TPA: type II secretion system protein [Epsilonproteobacteria bacterium]|nr:type II secretion system protein [Campylobacterota bacterium]
MRKAFSMVTAIFLIIMMSTLAVLVFNLSGKMVKSTSLQYRHAQAAFLARSYTELAVLAVINHERNATTRCVQTISGVVNGVIPNGPVTGNSLTGTGYDVNTYIYYLGNNLNQANISNTYWPNRLMPIVTDYNTTNPPLADSVAGIIVDVYVRYKDPAVVDAYTEAHGGATPTALQIPWITYHRRSLQKI